MSFLSLVKLVGLKSFKIFTSQFKELFSFVFFSRKTCIVGMASDLFMHVNLFLLVLLLFAFIFNKIFSDILAVYVCAYGISVGGFNTVLCAETLYFV